jgi:hypothetical protein
VSRRSYLWPAFVARPLGMPVPPNLFGLVAFGVLGAFLNPGFWLVGAGLEVLYLWSLSRSARFRAAVDAAEARPGAAEARRDDLLARLAPRDREEQLDLEARCGEIVATLRGAPGTGVHEESLARLAFLHLRLLGARVALRGILATSAEERGALDAREAELSGRLASPDVEEELRRSLEQQASVVAARRAAHAEAVRREARVDAEIERIRQQVALVREQALLAADEAEVGRAVDALSASLGEASRWLREDRELFAGLDDLSFPPPPLRAPAPARRGRGRSRLSSGEST